MFEHFLYSTWTCNLEKSVFIQFCKKCKRYLDDYFKRIALVCKIGLFDLYKPTSSVQYGYI